MRIVTGQDIEAKPLFHRIEETSDCLTRRGDLTPMMRTVQLSLGCEKVMIALDGVMIAEHEREFEKGRWVMSPLHCLKLLGRKVGAFEKIQV